MSKYIINIDMIYTGGLESVVTGLPLRQRRICDPVHKKIPEAMPVNT